MTFISIHPKDEGIDWLEKGQQNDTRKTLKPKKKKLPIFFKQRLGLPFFFHIQWL